nr:unnamed protein product [Callosobruchus analis]
MPPGMGPHCSSRTYILAAEKSHQAHCWIKISG